MQSVTPNVRNRSTAADTQRKGGRGGGVARETDAVSQLTNGAPGTVRPTTRTVAFSNKPTPSVIQRKGRRGRRPLRGVRVAGFSGAVGRRAVWGMVFHTCYDVCRKPGFTVARRVHRPRCTVVARLPSRVSRSRSARPILPTFITARQPRAHNPTHPISRAQPAHHFLRAHPRYPSTHAGRAWKPSPTV